MKRKSNIFLLFLTVFFLIFSSNVTQAGTLSTVKNTTSAPAPRDICSATLCFTIREIITMQEKTEQQLPDGAPMLPAENSILVLTTKLSQDSKRSRK